MFTLQNVASPFPIAPFHLKPPPYPSQICTYNLKTILTKFQLSAEDAIFLAKSANAKKVNGKVCQTHNNKSTDIAGSCSTLKECAPTLQVVIPSFKIVQMFLTFEILA